jgi:hypothetical protein
MRISTGPAWTFSLSDKIAVNRPINLSGQADGFRRSRRTLSPAAPRAIAVAVGFTLDRPHGGHTDEGRQ